MRLNSRAGRNSKPMDSRLTAASSFTEHQQRVLDGVGVWASYYRSNPHTFAEDYLHVKLKLFQKIILCMMMVSYTIMYLASRGQGKTFLSAIFVCVRCILYPGTKICIASGTRGQANLVLEKIMQELRPGSAELAAEIDEKETKMNAAMSMIVFKNGSQVKVVTATDSSRGNRAHILIIDEFRLVRKDVIDTILRKFLSTPRHPKFMDLPEYQGDKQYAEPNKIIYLSSAYFSSHWSYQKCKDTCVSMLNDKRHSFICGLPYQLALSENLLMEEQVIEEMSESDFNEIRWSMEMDCLFYGSSDGSFFDFETISKDRKVEYAMLPDKIALKLGGHTNNKFRIPPKLPGEIRILSADIALMASSKRKKNDASAIFINQMMPTKAGRYMNNIVYTENNEGMLTEEEALKIRKLYDEYSCDYIVLD